MSEARASAPPMERAHIRSVDCWCEPILRHTSATGVRVYVHRAWLHGGRQDIAPKRVVDAVVEVSELILPAPNHVPREMHLARSGTVDMDPNRRWKATRP